jgi:hypothetical protein
MQYTFYIFGELLEEPSFFQYSARNWKKLKEMEEANRKETLVYILQILRNFTTECCQMPKNIQIEKYIHMNNVNLKKSFVCTVH